MRSLAGLVGDYDRRIGPAVLAGAGVGGNSVSSALGIWLLLAACAPTAGGAERAALEETLGCPAAEAADELAAFLADPPAALASAVALWVRAGDGNEAVGGFLAGLPPEVEAGFMPTQAEADRWTEERTLGLIGTFPVAIDSLTRLILASVLATRVSWERPFEVVPTAERLGPESPWQGTVDRVLLRFGAEGSRLVRTEAAGIVAVQEAAAMEDVVVVSVSADQGVEPAMVRAAALEVSDGSPAISLFDLPLGGGHSWEITEREVPAAVDGERSERIESAALPAWSADSTHNLKGSGLFGVAPALSTLVGLLVPDPGGDDTEAVQRAVASYSRTGFEAAAVTVFAVRVGSARPAPPTERGVERTAILRFDHPHAVVARAGSGGRYGGLPLFSAWVAQPEEPGE